MSKDKKTHDIRSGTEVESTEESPDDKERADEQSQIRRWVKSSKKRTI